jgi:AcrR family transcriptional regulator
MSKVSTYRSQSFSSSKFALVQLLSRQLIDGGVNQSLRQLAASVGTSHRVLLHHFDDHDQLLRECLLYINEVVVSRLDSIDVPSPCTPHDLARVITRASRGMDIFHGGLWFEIVAHAARDKEPFNEIAREIERNWVDVLVLRLGMDRGSALGLIASSEGIAVLEAILGRTASRSAKF